jgi:hypothetical protein
MVSASTYDAVTLLIIVTCAFSLGFLVGAWWHSLRKRNDE